MPTEVKLPDLGDGVESGEILEVLVSPGQEIAKDQGLFVVETDKATVEVPAPQAGRVASLLVEPGQTVRPGQPLLTLDSAGSTAPVSQAPVSTSDRSSAPALAAQTPPPADASPPTVKPTVTQEAATARAESGPSPTPRATATSTVARSAKPPLTSSAEEEITAEASRTTAKIVPPVPPPDRGSQPIPAGPAIRRFAREVGVDLQKVQGTGPGGRITREDVLEVVRMANRTVKENGSTDTEANLPGQPGFDEFGPVRIDTATKIRRTIAAKMAESWSSVARVTNFDDADVTELERMRQSSKQDYAASGIKLTNMPFLIKAVSMALRRHPSLNAVYDAEKGQIIYKRYINIGMAVDSERGLVVPVLRNADQMSIAETARQIASQAERVRTNKFTLEDLRGGTFTVSNLGAIGGTYSTPIVNVPEVAILLAGRAQQRPVVVDDQIVIRLMLPLSLSYDHRLVDGAAAARFLNDVIDYLEAPGRLLLAP